MILPKVRCSDKQSGRYRRGSFQKEVRPLASPIRTCPVNMNQHNMTQWLRRKESVCFHPCADRNRRGAHTDIELKVSVGSCVVEFPSKYIGDFTQYSPAIGQLPQHHVLAKIVGPDSLIGVQCFQQLHSLGRDFDEWGSNVTGILTQYHKALLTHRIHDRLDVLTAYPLRREIWLTVSGTVSIAPRTGHRATVKPPVPFLNTDGELR